MTHSERKTVFALGGVKSGKSRFALAKAKELASGGPVRFIATATFDEGDSSMGRRIQRHRDERPSDWTTFEEPLDLPAVISAPGPETVMVVDCLTLWLSNVLLGCGNAESDGFGARSSQEVSRRLDALADALHSSSASIILIANDVGSGVAPVTKIGNVFADEQGIINQRIAAACDEVYHLVAGIPQRIK